MSPELLSAIADVVRAAAWPCVVLFLSYRYRAEVGRLIDRLRKGGVAEFDPVNEQQHAVAPTTPSIDGSTHALAAIRSAAVQRWEAELRATPLLANETDPGKREALLITIATKAVMISNFAQFESVMYASQIALLSYLNAQPAGDILGKLRELFYAPALVRQPEVLGNYPFENYMAFLTNALFVHITDGTATLTDVGRDYLLWRVEAQRPPRAIG